MIVNRKEIMKAFPELNWIKDETLREKVALVWQEACRMCEWDNLYDARAVNSYDPKMRPCDSLIQHTRFVADCAYQCGKVNNLYMPEKVNLDIILAGALLHDVCKLVEKEPNGTSSWGNYITHGILSVCLSWKKELPIEVLHIITAHTKHLDMPAQTQEAAIVHHCDYLAAECMHLGHG